MAYFYKQHPNWMGSELQVMGYSATAGKAANAVGIVPVKSKTVGETASKDPAQPPSALPWSSGVQGQLAAAAAVLGAIYFLR